jgi:hypothetical protein
MTWKIRGTRRGGVVTTRRNIKVKLMLIKNGTLVIKNITKNVRQLYAYSSLLHQQDTSTTPPTIMITLLFVA